MKISFCIIAYNEELLIEQQLKNLYPHAHEIILVIGRVLEFGDKFPKKSDRTLQKARHFPDPDRKIRIFHNETWNSKEDMVRLYYSKAKGDYVWHIDCDEFYTAECIEQTREFIAQTRRLNYCHDEYYYYRYYNVVIARDGVKFWNSPARIHKKIPGGVLTHRPQLLRGSPSSEILKVPRSIGIRHHYSIMDVNKVKDKARFYGYDLHKKYFWTYESPLHKLIEKRICVRPDNDRNENSVPEVLTPEELETPSGIDSIFSYYSHRSYPWTQ